MGNLNAFLAENAIKAENEKVVVSKRFIDEKGNPIKWEIRTISSDEDESIRKECTKRVPVAGKHGQYTRETDIELYLSKMAVACTVFPNLNDSQLQDSYKAMGAEQLIKAMLLPGEYSTYLETLQKINGFNETMDDLMGDVKN